jgi:HAD superfamily hydrolase (TIGR01509 family)
MTRLVIFDCDGVLVDTEAMISRARLAILAPLGVTATETDLMALRGLSGNDAYAVIASQFGIKLPEDIRERFRIAINAELKNGLTPTKGVEALIDTLAAPFCVASNGSHKFMAMTLGAAGLAGKFVDNIFSADDVPRPKPHPDLFLDAAARMKAQPDRCIVIEDSVHGVTAGVTAGMQVISFCGHRPDKGDELAAAGASKVCSSMEEVTRQLSHYGCLR